MDGLSRVSETLPDVGAAERIQDVRRQTKGELRGAPQRGSKKRKSKPATASRDGRGSLADKEGGRLLQNGSGEETSVGRERSEECYGRDRTIAPIPPKGRLIDIAI